ncbi:PUB_domain_containing_protein_-_putative [Leishmania major strain Friedlin]|nr:PUB_domain_containing_protein_-_putative [Leishmania major strain Friedlin]
MSSSLADEIAQLHELFKLGALTQEEFNEAKQATIRSFKTAAAAKAASAPVPGVSSASLSESPACSSLTSTKQQPNSSASPGYTETDARGQLAPPSPNASASPSVHTVAATRSRTFEEWKELWDTAKVSTPAATASTASAPPDAFHARMQALRCLSRLLCNVRMYPAEPKYRRIRESNRIIAHELMSVAEASGAVLSFAGFVRERDEEDASTSASAAGAATHCWVLHGEATAATVAGKAAVAVRLVDELLEYFGEQQSRRYRVQQLWRSVALEVRLERAARGADSRSPLQDVPDHPEEVNNEKEKGNGKGGRGAVARSAESAAPSPPQALLSYLAECYTVDEAGDGLFSSMCHLQTLQRLYEEAAAHIAAGAQPSSSHSLLRTAEVYGAVVQQRGAVELLVYGCGACFHPPPVATQRVLAATASTLLTASSAPLSDTANDYTVQLVPTDTPDASEFVARCLQLLQRLRREVERVQQERARAARQAAEASMRQELKRERQRRQLEKNSGRDEMSADEQTQQWHQRRRTHRRGHGVHRRAGSSSSTSSSASSASSRGAATKTEGQRIPLTEALAILMGKMSPPSSRPPPASSSS